MLKTNIAQIATKSATNTIRSIVSGKNTALQSIKLYLPFISATKSIFIQKLHLPKNLDLERTRNVEIFQSATPVTPATIRGKENQEPPTFGLIRTRCAF